MKIISRNSYFLIAQQFSRLGNSLLTCVSIWSKLRQLLKLKFRKTTFNPSIYHPVLQCPLNLSIWIFVCFIYFQPLTSTNYSASSTVDMGWAERPRGETMQKARIVKRHAEYNALVIIKDHCTSLSARVMGTGTITTRKPTLWQLVRRIK